MKTNNNTIVIIITIMKFDVKLWKAVVLMCIINFAISIENILFKKMIDDGVNRMVATTYRLIIGTIFLTPFAIFFERKNRPPLTSNILCLLFLSALLGTSLGQYFFLIGLQYTSSTYALAFSNMVPAVTFVLALILREETVDLKKNIGRAKVIGTMISICEALVLTFYKGTPLTHSSKSETQTKNLDNTTHKWMIGSLMLIISVAFWSFWFLVQTRLSRRYSCQYTSATILSIFGAIQSALLSLISERSKSMWLVSNKLYVLSVVYAGIAVGLCCVGMSWCLQERGPVFTTSFIPLIQVFAAILSFSFFHEQIFFGSVIGSLVVIIGLYILLWGKSKDTSQPVIRQDQLEQIDEEASGTTLNKLNTRGNETSPKD